MTFYYASLRACKSLRQVFLLSCLLSVPAVAMSPLLESHIDHPRIMISEALSFDDILQAAINRAPQRAMDDAYRQSAKDQRRFADKLITGAPRLNLSYWDDEYNDATGLREMEASIEVDLWQWGQKKNAQRLADNLGRGADSWQQYFRLSLAGEIRNSLHQLAMADARLDNAQQAVSEAEALLHASQTMLNTGAASRNTLLQSQALVLEARQLLLSEQANQIDAERGYYQLTGLSLRPAAFSEAAPLQPSISLQHPQLQFLNDQRQQQASQVERARYAAADNTSVSFGMRRERGSALEPEIDSLGIAISIPFGGGSQRKASASAAAIALTEADVRLQQAQRKLVMQLHEAEHQLGVTEQSIAYAETNCELQKERWQMTQKAFSLGESDIQPTILALRAYRESQLQLRLLEIQHTALISSLKQTVGELP